MQDKRSFGLVWKSELRPSSVRCLTDLGVAAKALPPGTEQVCVYFDEKKAQVRCAPTNTREAMVNLSYLACALRVLQEHKREPQFSLDPADPKKIHGELQVKAFYPSWLENTVFGEVLFQAYYLLKEISFGDYEVKGLPTLQSCFEMSAKSTKPLKEPTASRQWFVVNQASVGVAKDGVLLPKVEMGVEARQLELGPKGYTDAPSTDPKEPSVVMAKEVTRLFPEIAARVPVVNELVEVARASLLARFLLEKGVRVDTEVLERYSLPTVGEQRQYRKSIPTLRKERTSSSISDQGDGQLTVSNLTHSMYGGVDLAVKTEKVEAKPLPKPYLDPKLGGEKGLVPLPLFAVAAAA